MLNLYREDREKFERRYHRRSLVEAVYSVLKTVFGNHLSSRRRRVQTRELMCRVTAYNIDRINLAAIQEQGDFSSTALH